MCVVIPETLYENLSIAVALLLYYNYSVAGWTVIFLSVWQLIFIDKHGWMEYSVPVKNYYIGEKEWTSRQL